MDFQEKVLKLNPFHLPSRFILSKSLLKSSQTSQSLKMIEPLEIEPSFKKEWIQIFTQSIYQKGEQSKAIEMLKAYENRNFELNLILSKMLINTKKDLDLAKLILEKSCNNNAKLSNLDQAECKQLKSQLLIAFKSKQAKAN